MYFTITSTICLHRSTNGCIEIMQSLFTKWRFVFWKQIQFTQTINCPLCRHRMITCYNFTKIRQLLIHFLCMRLKIKVTTDKNFLMAEKKRKETKQKEERKTEVDKSFTGTLFYISLQLNR